MKKSNITLQKPTYKMWDYEERLRKKEIEKLMNFKKVKNETDFQIQINPSKLEQLQRLAFSSSVTYDGKDRIPTWQGLLENGESTEYLSKRKESKYVTHGLHQYKGKFYPQLVKSILNIGQISTGSRILDPFCGSGTVALEGYLNGFESYGCDLNPLAVEIAQAKVKILSIEPRILENTLNNFIRKIEGCSSSIGIDYFKQECHDEILRWFPKPVIYKLSNILVQIDNTPNQKIRQFLLVVLSNIIRSVSQQEPRDLRVRRRKVPIRDASVIEIYKQYLAHQLSKILKFHHAKKYYKGKFFEPHIWEGDSRQYSTFTKNGLVAHDMDAVVTSPPYATALPYLDTDRLSLLAVFGLSSRKRNTIEEEITGSREISNGKRLLIEEKIKTSDFENIKSSKAVDLIKKIHRLNNDSKVGFRRKNMASLLYRYFNDLAMTFSNLDELVIRKGSIFVIIGDNYTIAGDSKINIETTEIVKEIGRKIGWKIEDTIPITVTTEGLKHIKHAIRKNAIIHFRT